jgi:hypothetical protein
VGVKGISHGNKIRALSQVTIFQICDYDFFFSLSNCLTLEHKQKTNNQQLKKTHMKKLLECEKRFNFYIHVPMLETPT